MKPNCPSNTVRMVVISLSFWVCVCGGVSYTNTKSFTRVGIDHNCYDDIAVLNHIMMAIVWMFAFGDR